MSYENKFEQQWLTGVMLELPTNGDSRMLCPYAVPFKSYCEALLAETLRYPTDISVNLAQLDLQTKFHAWYSHAPAACLRHFKPKKGFLCLYQIYHETYMQVFELHNRVIPPRLREAPPIQVIEVDGPTLGEFTRR